MPPYHDDSPAENNLDLPLLSVRTAREAAYVAIEEYLDSGTWVNEVLDRIFRTASLPPIERGLATELACGVVRRLATLDSILSQLVARPLEKVELPLLTILRLGIYQLALLDAVPPHAAVHETVELDRGSAKAGSTSRRYRSAAIGTPREDGWVSKSCVMNRVPPRSTPLTNPLHW